MLPKGGPMARTLDFVLADVFTDGPFGGNPLALFPRVRELAACESGSKSISSIATRRTL
jgi:hypothetical protein